MTEFKSQHHLTASETAYQFLCLKGKRFPVSVSSQLLCCCGCCWLFGLEFLRSPVLPWPCA